jgi:HD superfamily phosphodiesterase
MTTTIAGLKIPDSKLARDVTEMVRDTASPLLFHHSSRVYYFGALAGKRRGLRFDEELLYTGAMFHDMGLTHQHSSADERFEVDGANAARDFLRLIISRKRISTRSGPRSRCTPRPESRSTCMRW